MRCCCCYSILSLQVDGKQLCWLCTMAYKRAKSKARKSRLEYQQNTPQSTNSSDHQATPKQHSKEDQKHHHSQQDQKRSKHHNGSEQGSHRNGAEKDHRQRHHHRHHSSRHEKTAAQHVASRHKGATPTESR